MKKTMRKPRSDIARRRSRATLEPHLTWRKCMPMAAVSQVMKMNGESGCEKLLRKGTKKPGRYCMIMVRAREDGDQMANDVKAEVVSRYSGAGGGSNFACNAHYAHGPNLV